MVSPGYDTFPIGLFWGQPLDHSTIEFSERQGWIFGLNNHTTDTNYGQSRLWHIPKRSILRSTTRPPDHSTIEFSERQGLIFGLNHHTTDTNYGQSRLWHIPDRSILRSTTRPLHHRVSRNTRMNILTQPPYHWHRVLLGPPQEHSHGYWRTRLTGASPGCLCRQQVSRCSPRPYCSQTKSLIAWTDHR